MPINQLPEWYIQKGKYERAETLAEKIKELEREEKMNLEGFME